MNVLVLNAGSSTLKFHCVDTDAARIADDGDRRLARGVIERIGGEAVIVVHREDGGRETLTAPLRSMADAVDWIVSWLTSPASGTGLASRGDLHAVGHRVVHGGEAFRESVRITDAVQRTIEDMIELAPLHNAHNLAGIRAARHALGDGVPQVAVFDTAFHHTLPEHAYLYALPYPLYRRHKVRRYGFHGTSHRSVAWRWGRLTGTPRDRIRIVTLHLGNGCSACAIDGGRSIDTSMGFTPLEGLVMGTRSGDVDAAILDYVATKEGLSLPQVEALLNAQSGLLGVSGLTSDMRDLLAEAAEHDDRRAKLAIRMFCYRVTKYIGAYLAVLGGADAIVFAGGIGENAPSVRAMICAPLRWAGLLVDEAANDALTGGRAGAFTTADAGLAAWVVPTDEELLIARDTFRVLHALPAPI